MAAATGMTAVLRVCAAAVLCAAVLPGTTAVASPTTSPAIVGGQDAEEPYGFMVSISAEGEHICGAAVIAPEWMLTAAHCVQGWEPETLTLRTGSVKRSAGGEQPAIDELIPHPRFEWSAGHDIALIRLVEPVAVSPLPLDTDVAVGTPSRILGWGQTCPEPDCGAPPENLQQLDVEIIDPTRCADIDRDLELCISNPGGDSGACYGDSGGPQIVRANEEWALVGITSRAGYNGANCAEGPSIFTNAIAFADWIAEVTGRPAPA